MPETKSWTYNWEECGFVCDTNYVRNWTMCVSSWSNEQQNQNEESNISASNNSFKKDYCPNWDYSDSYYDGDCWILNEHSNGSWGTHSSAWNIEIDDIEVRDAYERAYSNNIIDNYVANQDIDGVLTRWYMAKLMVNFIIKMWLVVRPTNIPTECLSWNDNNYLWESDDIKNYATLSCAFGIMWIDMPNNEFRPNDIVNRAEFGTIISRILWWNRYDIVWDNKMYYYRKHLVALKQNGIMKEIQNPTNRKELIKWVLVVLKRIYDKD